METKYKLIVNGSGSYSEEVGANPTARSIKEKHDYDYE